MRPRDLVNPAGASVALGPGNDYAGPRPGPVGARLSRFTTQWLRSVTDSWTIDIVTKGLRLSFNSPPPLSYSPKWTKIPVDIQKAAALRGEVQALLEKDAIGVLSPPYPPGFYSTLFLVPKSNGQWRPVIDLSALNDYITPPTFKMETVQRLWRTIDLRDWAVSVDLTDAYLHVPMNVASRRYLRFAIDGVVYFFKAIPFGLNLAPWVFTRLIDTALAGLRGSISSQVSNYLDDFLLKNLDKKALEADLRTLLQYLQDLGFLVNLEK